MTIRRQIAEAYAGWMDSVAASVAALLGRLAAPPTIRLTERASGTFAIETAAGKPQAAVAISGGVATCSPVAAAMLNGRRVEMALRADRFFFRPLEVPSRAADFLNGVVRAQIDRITPWTADEAIFGWSAPTEIAQDRISITVAAAARAQIVPLTQAVGELGAKSVAVSTALPGQAPIKVFDQSASGALEAQAVRRKLTIGLAAMAMLAVLAVAVDAVIGDQMRARQDEISQRIAERRGLLRTGADAIANSALAKLEQRKNESAASVIVLEALSNVLPDNTYVTELRIEADKVQVVGITKDAPALIRLIERSPHFSRATFFAPTTRGPSDPGDRFHIEAQIKPVFSPPS
jgi:general secretion pathway protein L